MRQKKSKHHWKIFTGICVAIAFLLIVILVGLKIVPVNKHARQACYELIDCTENDTFTWEKNFKENFIIEGVCTCNDRTLNITVIKTDIPENDNSENTHNENTHNENTQTNLSYEGEYLVETLETIVIFGVMFSIIIAILTTGIRIMRPIIRDL